MVEYVQWLSELAVIYIDNRLLEDIKRSYHQPKWLHYFVKEIPQLPLPGKQQNALCLL